MRKLVYQRERVSDLWNEAGSLLEKHWHEIAHWKDIVLDPDIGFYAAGEAAGLIRCYTARDGDNLVGYVVFFVRHNPHYRASLQAVQDVLFLLPEYRSGMAGVRLIREAERYLASEGVQVVYHHVKRTNKVGELLVRLGYEIVDEIYAKRLD
jgi:GNAT superfamily N-acetyltransferase